MSRRAYLSTIHPAWPLDRQRDILGGGVTEYVDEFGTVTRKRRNPDVLTQRAALLRPTSRRSAEVIEVASPACFAFTAKDFMASLAAAANRGATVVFKDTGLTIEPSPETPKLDMALEQFQAASRKRGLHQSREEVAEARRKDTLRRIALIADDWPKKEPSTRELLARAGVKPGKPMAPATAVAHLDYRPKAQKAYELAQAREAGRRAGKTPGRKPKA